MRVSLSWLKELVDIKISDKALAELLPLRTIGTKEVTENFIELDMKGYNRPDLLSMRGVAREAAAIAGGQIKFTEDEPDLGDLWGQKKDLDVEIRDENLCPFYALVKIDNLKVGPSPKEWVKKLSDCGIRSINNAADITNLVMLEFGQPMHAFDSAKVEDEKIIVRVAKDGEEIETLDGKKRILGPSDLLITDPKQALGIAGVMGGKDSEISDSTKTILLEAAIFNPENIRRTATKLGLVSEAGKRFYHGLTKKALYSALNSAIKMYEELGGKVSAFSIRDNLEQKVPEINLRQDKVDSLIGVEIPAEKIGEYLERLGFVLTPNTSQLSSSGSTRGSIGTRFPIGSGMTDSVVWTVKPPYWRKDINIEEDLIEEVARLYGYEKIPAKPLEGNLPEKVDQSLFETIYKVKQTLVDEGLTEVQTYSFYSTDVLKNIGFWPDNLDNLVKIANPISTETEYMRIIIWHNLLEVVAKNFKQGFGDMAIFEIGKVYSTKNGQADEDYNLGIAVMNGTDDPIGELYQIIKVMAGKLNLKLELGDQKKDKYEEAEFHPNRFQHLLINGQEAGKVAEVHPRIVNRFGLDKRVAIAEIPLKILI